MDAKTISLLLLALSTETTGCAETINSEQCPVKTIILDAGVDGLPDVGEYGFDRVCEPFCGPNLPVCRRVKELVMTCQPGCG